MTTSATSKHCTVCNSPDTIEVDTPDDYEYSVTVAERFRMRRCRACETQFIWPRPSIEELAAMYPDTYYAYESDVSPFWEALYNRRCRGEAKRLMSLSGARPIRLFDIGTGDCRHFRAIGAAGDFTFGGVELNADVAATAREEGYDVTAGSFEDFDPTGREGSVDILNMNHVIEHVIDPHETLAKIYTLLDEGGVYYGRTPKLPSNGLRLFRRYWGGYHFPRHLHLFSAKSLELALRKAGFRNVEIVEDINLFPALSLQNFLVGKLRLPLQIKAGHSRFWTLFVALATPLIALDYLMRRGDCMLFIARK